MARIELSGVTKTFGGDVRAVDGLELDIPDKRFVALLGPSGCGKSTTMNMIAGIERPSQGDIRFDGKSVLRLAPAKRGIGFVFQNYAIFTHMTVFENLAFGLRVCGVADAEVKRRVGEMAEMMRLTDRLHWSSAKLSVNEMQKLAIGRSAIVQPSIFLLDEPLSNLDAAFREFMRTELKRIQHHLQQTMVYVTHDQIEAMSLADRIAVMDRGILQQYGTPAEIYDRPANTFVANFIGSPPMNLLPCRASRDGAGPLLDLGEAGRLVLHEPRLRAAVAAAREPELILGVRPEDVHVLPGPVRDAPQDGSLRFRVDLVEPIGPRTILHLTAGALETISVREKRFAGTAHDAVAVELPQARCHVFDRRTGGVLTANASGGLH